MKKTIKEIWVAKQEGKIIKGMYHKDSHDFNEEHASIIAELIKLIPTNKNKFFVYEKNGTLRAAQTTKKGALLFMNEHRILISIEV